MIDFKSNIRYRNDQESFLDSKVSLLANQEDLINRPESISTEKEATIIETIDHTRPSIGLSSNQQLPLCSLKRTVSGGIEMMSTFSIESICFAQYHPDIYNQSYYSSIPFFDACPTIFPANTIVDMNYDTTTGDTNNDGIDELITIYHYIVTNTQTSDVEEYNKLIISQLNNATGLFETIYSNDLTHLLLWPSIIALDYDGDGQDEIVAGGTVIQDIYDVLYEDLRYVFYDFNPSDNYENPSIYSTLHIRYFDTMNRILIDSYGTISPDFFVNPHFSGKKNFIFEKGDINGDYKEDLLVIHPEGRDRACFDIVSFRDYYYDTLADRTYLRISYKGNRVEEKHMVRPILADFDNDGMDEVIVPRAKIDDYYNQSVDPSIQSKIYKLIGNEFKVIGTFESALMVGAADINGDFRTDIIYYNPNKRSLSTINLYSGFPEDSNETVTREHSNSKYRPNSVSDWRRNVKRVCTPLKIYCEDIDYDGEPEIIVPFEEEYYKWGWTLFIAHYDDMDHLKEHKILSHSFAVYDTVIAPVELPSEEEEWPMNQFQVPKLKTGFEFKHEYEVIFGEDYKPVFGDFDGDACQLQYNSEHWESISEPTVFAVVAPPPTARGHGVNQIQSGGTTIGRSEGTTTGTSETLATHISTVAYVGIDFEAEFNIFGIKLAESGYGAEAGFIINHDTSRTRSESFTITFDESWTFSGEEDGVIYAVTTFQNYNYTFISHRNQSLIGEIVTIRCPEVTAIRKMNLDDFDVTFPQYKLRQSLPLFEHEIGKPETYPRISQIPVSTEDKMVYKTALKEVGRGYGSKSIGISFQSQDATSKSSTLAMGGYAGAYIKLGAGGISVKAGFRFTATESVGSSTNFAIGRGFSFSASVGDLAPVDFSDFRYHFGMFLSEETISYEIEGEDYFIDILMLHYYTEHLGPAYSEGARLGLEIHDDSAFDNLMSNYGFPGFGTESDPYIIENWNRIISNMSAIAIENTSRYFVIQNCNIATSIGEEFTGIYLKNVDGAIIEFCSITGFSTGIFLINCRNIQILNNNIQQFSDM